MARPPNAAIAASIRGRSVSTSSACSGPRWGRKSSGIHGILRHLGSRLTLAMRAISWAILLSSASAPNGSKR